MQHALRAYTPKDQKAVKTAAETFRANPDFKTDEAIMNLETGEALVSFLDAKGAPEMVERAKILFPLSQIGAITDTQRSEIIKQSRIYGKYDEMVDRESAYEKLSKLAEEAEKAENVDNAEVPDKSGPAEKSEKKNSGFMGKVLKAVVTAVTSTLAAILGTIVSDAVTGKKTKSRTSKTGRVVKNATSAATRTITKELTRDILGNLVKK